MASVTRDDGIEVIEESDSSNGTLQELSPNFLTCPQPQIDLTRSTVDPGSVHALQTAFNSLHRSHNEQTKKCSDLEKKNKYLNKILTDMDYPLKYDPRLQFEEEVPSMAQAAGATSEAGVADEQYQAEQGYKKYLMRKLMQNDYLVQRSAEEIEGLNARISHLERVNQEILQDRDSLHQDLDAMSESLEQKQQEISARDSDIKQMVARINVLEQELSSSQQQCETLRERVELYEHTTAGSSREQAAEIQDLKQQIQTAEERGRALQSHLADKENLLVKNERKISELELKCRQYDIQVNAGKRPERQLSPNPTIEPVLSLEGYDEVDSIDLEVAELRKAVEVVQQQRQSISGIQTEVQQQNVFLKRLESGKVAQKKLEKKVAESRPEVVGSSLRPQYKEVTPSDRAPSPVYGNISPAMGNKSLLALDSPPEYVLNEAKVSPISYPNRTLVDNERRPNAWNIQGFTAPLVQPVRPSSTSPGQGGRRDNVVDSTSFARPTLPEVSPNRIDGGFHRLSTSERPPSGQVVNLRQSKSEVLLQASPVSPANELSRRSPSTGSSTVSPGARTVTSARLPVENVELQLHRQSAAHDNRYYGESSPDYENIYNPNVVDVTENPRHLDTKGRDNVRMDASPVRRPVVDRGGLRTGLTENVAEQSVSAVKICPVCSQEFSRLTMDDFQTHVFECFDEESPATLQGATAIATGEVTPDVRVCPMCNQSFPCSVSQEVYEGHVMAHFGDDPVAERFEVIQP